MTRCPVFRATCVDDAVNIRRFIETEFPKLHELVRRTTKHGELQSATCWVVGRLVYARFGFSTGDAMGMNMVTIATEALSRWVEKKTGARLVSLSSNVCSAKKAAGVNFLLGRGTKVVAEATIPKSVLQPVLHTSARAIVEVLTVKHYIGSALALAPGFLNSQIANVLAGVFLATGQDLAQVVESSMGIVVAEVEGRDSLYISVTLPCLEIGTVGGGTSLTYAKHSLEHVRPAMEELVRRRSDSPQSSRALV